MVSACMQDGWSERFDACWGEASAVNVCILRCGLSNGGRLLGERRWSIGGPIAARRWAKQHEHMSMSELCPCRTCQA
eukprot:13975758-Alexandrium_andersonii.AAC.1